MEILAIVASALKLSIEMNLQTTENELINPFVFHGWKHEGNLLK